MIRISIMVDTKELLHVSITKSVARLRSKFNTGITRSLEFRLQQLSGIAKMLKDHESTFIHALNQDMGRPALEAYSGDLAVMNAEIYYIQKNLKKWVKPT